MKLYYSQGACSFAPHLALRESGLRFTLEAVNLGTGHYKGGEFSNVNPKGYVPTLELDNGEILTEGAVILQYIADKASEKNLIPKTGTMERYRCQEWLNYIATEVHKTFGLLWNDQMPEEAKKFARVDLEKKFDFLSNNLKGKSYLMGDQYTVADSYLYTVMNWSNYLKLDLTKWPTLMGFMEKVKTRPATMEALKAEDLL